MIMDSVLDLEELNLELFLFPSSEVTFEELAQVAVISSFDFWFSNGRLCSGKNVVN